MKEYWWFSGKDHKLGYGDGREAAIGATHTVDGPIKMCKKGLHASRKALDALQYASGPCAWLVGLGGSILDGGDKSCATERTYIAGGSDATEVLRAFARRVALDVAHLWKMPEIVRDYLETGDESMRADSSAASSSASSSDASSDARSDSSAASSSTSSSDAWAASWAASSSASSSDASFDARSAAWAASWAASSSASWADASYAANYAARAKSSAKSFTTWDAAICRYDGWLDEMLRAALNKSKGGKS